MLPRGITFTLRLQSPITVHLGKNKDKNSTTKEALGAGRGWKRAIKKGKPAFGRVAPIKVFCVMASLAISQDCVKGGGV
jgi:hypothetical protein